ncbi:MAG: DEAD/DEAH box helicase, partial [Candidatus Cloacimonetes bacterium]|nr:DEAD/DEAH box helicase [Candidatus Cloacimonadota bacterium]
KLRKGISFKTDSEWQTEMEEAFIYDDTPDQATATLEIKQDMESSTPMERLLCGDVGFGKTEVAVRVAFKAVLSGYQVAVVVPTTLLAEQHYNVFRERLAQFPIRLAMLSRFRTNAEIKNDLAKIKEGKVDIVIGTHRILSKDVEFHRIGLLIIDEEHRFGVRHKDRIRQIKSNIDTLYMSATPIPRTMNMVISKLKSMSLIQTSPKARLPIRTVIVPFDTEVIKDAIMREYDRGGQVFFVHNRVETIQTIYHQLHTLLPNLRMAVAHGQLPEKQLEKIMTEFSEHKYDVLIATTIIESGIDIPNANTILVNRSDMFGMAQLYQIRGRVGRSNKRAYAYLMIPNNLTDDARKRLETLTEYESLGAGYQIAMRDLEIRGAGTLLGTKQSGTIASIGFNFYNRLLDQAVNNIMSANPEGMWHSEEEADELLKIELGTDFFFPPEYITNEKQKLQIYRRMIDFTAGEQFDDLVEELTDRYGALPETAKNVIDYFRLRMTAKNIGLKTFMILSQKMFLEYDVKSLPDRDTLPAIIAFSEVPVSFNATSGLKITFEFSPEMAADKRGKIDFALKLIDFLVGLGKSQSVGNDA